MKYFNAYIRSVITQIKVNMDNKIEKSYKSFSTQFSMN